jgi:hypothetical protein
MDMTSMLIGAYGAVNQIQKEDAALRKKNAIKIMLFYGVAAGVIGGVLGVLLADKKITGAILGLIAGGGVGLLGGYVIQKKNL